MSQEITVARAWCEEHLADCYFAYDESTGENTHKSFSPPTLSPIPGTFRNTPNASIPFLMIGRSTAS